MRRSTPILVLAAVLAAPSPGWAEAAAEPPPAPPEVGRKPEARAPKPEAEPEVEDGAAFALMEARLRQTEELVRSSRPSVTLGGYVDLGFFVPYGIEAGLYRPPGNGAGYIQDFGHTVFPEYENQYGWVFLGDILGPAVNTRGEVTDLGDAPGVNRFDRIDSRGAYGFVANEVNLQLRSALTPTALVSTSVNFAPRTGSAFAFGDAFDVDLAQLEWLPTASQRTSIFVGKVDSVLGIEYRERKSDRRFGITPSLIARYTIGTALGLKVRTKLGEGDWLVLAGAVTNGSFTTEPFHFYDEIDSNNGKTASGRISARLPERLPFTAEVGVSGSYGAQDRATDVGHPIWFVGPDLIVRFGWVEVKGQWLTGRASGQAAQGVYGLRLDGGGYLEAHAMVTPSFGLIGRGEYRDAFVWLATERAYLTRSWRATMGFRWVATARAVLKAEYLVNGEYGRIPDIPNDVFTSSLVLGF